MSQPARPTGPAPRVESFAEVLDRVRARPPAGQRRRIVGIAGAPGAGKTTLVEAILGALGGGPQGRIAHVPMDGFHLADVELARLGRLDRKGAPDTFDVDGYAAFLGRIRATAGTGETVYAPAFDRDLEQPVAGSIAVLPTCELVLTEGNYLLLDDAGWSRVRAALDEVWFVAADDGLRRARLVDRHVRFGKERARAEAWVADVDEPNAGLVAATRARADLIVAGGAVPAPEGSATASHDV